MGLKIEAEAGMEFELCTKEDVAAAVKESLRDQSEQIWEGNNFATDGAGNANAFIYSVPVGKKLVLQRLVIWADGSTPRTSSAVGWWALLAEGPNFMAGNVLEFAPQVQQTQALPFINDYGFHDAPIWQGGSDVWFYGQALVASTNLSVNFQALLVPTGRHRNHLGPLDKAALLDDNNDPNRQGRRGR